MESDTKRPGGAAHVVGRLAFIRSLQTALNIHPSDSLGYNNNNNNNVNRYLTCHGLNHRQNVSWAGSAESRHRFDETLV